MQKSNEKLIVSNAENCQICCELWPSAFQNDANKTYIYRRLIAYFLKICSESFNASIPCTQIRWEPIGAGANVSRRKAILPWQTCCMQWHRCSHCKPGRQRLSELNLFENLTKNYLFPSPLAGNYLLIKACEAALKKLQANHHTAITEIRIENFISQFSWNSQSIDQSLSQSMIQLENWSLKKLFNQLINK